MIRAKSALGLHEHIPPGYYEKSIKRNPLQWFWHTRRFENVGELIDPVGGEILDIGCADGTFTKVIFDRAQPKRIIGIDIVKSSIDYTKKKFRRNKRMRFLVADAQKLPFKNNSFEAVFCLEALEHVFDSHRVLLEIKRVLRPGGYTIVLVPTDNFLFRIAWWFVLQTWGKHWRETHLQSFNRRNGLARALSVAGFKVVQDKKFLLGMLEAVKAKKARG